MALLEEREEALFDLLSREGEIKSQRSFQKIAKEAFISDGLSKIKEGGFQYVLWKPVLEILESLKTAKKNAESLQKEPSTIKFFNGIFLEECSDFPKDLMQVTHLKDPASLSQFLNKQSMEVLQNETSPFVHLNFALDSYGILISLKKFTKIDTPVKLVFLTDGMSQENLSSRVFIYLAEGASLDIEIVHEASATPSFVNHLTICQIEEKAVLNVSEEVSEGHALSHHIRVMSKENSQFNWVTFNANAAFFREDVKIALKDKEATSHYTCLNLTKQSHQAHQLTEVLHLAENTYSHQHVKNLSFDSSRTSFEGKIFVDKIAQKTQAYQLNQNMILSEKAANFSKPNLQIFADDVKASHGATFTKLSEEELFYLKSRGLDEKTASSYLLLGFIEQILLKVESESSREALRAKFKVML